MITMLPKPLQQVAVYALAALVVLVAVYLYGEAKERQGARKVTVEFMEQDLEGAANVRERAREILDGLDDGDDPDSLLRATGGFRDEPGDVSPTE